MIMNISDFSELDFKYAFEINAEFDVFKDTKDDLTVITIDNFFKYPNDVLEALKQFPINNKDKFYEELQSDRRILQPPGKQQLLPSGYFEGVSYILHKLLVEHDFVPFDFESSQQFDKLGAQLSQYVYYTNIFYPGMPNLNNSHNPHFDQSTFAYNIFLSDAEIGGGTSFYKLKHDGEEYSNIDDIMEIEDHDAKMDIRDKLNSMNITTDEDPENYIAPEETDLWKKYYTIPYEFNKLTLYKGTFWHTADYNSATETDLRYSLAAIYTPQHEEEDFN